MTHSLFPSERRRVGVTGATGFLGTHLTAALSKSATSSVVPLVRSPSGPVDHMYTFGRPPDPELIRSLDTVVHLAWETNSRSVDSAQASVRASMELADVALLSGKRFIFVSTMSAQGGPNSRYAASKIDVEQFVLSKGGVVLRPGLIISSPPVGLWKLLAQAGRSPVIPMPAHARVFVVRLAILLEDLARLIEHDQQPLNTTATSVRLDELISIASSRHVKPVPIPARVMRPVSRALGSIESTESLADSLRGIMETPQHPRSADRLYPIVSEP